MLKHVFFALFVIGILVNPNTTEAAKNWEQMTANEFLQETQNIWAKSTTSEISNFNLTRLYKSTKDKKPLYIATSYDGLFIDSATTPIIKYNATSSYETGKGFVPKEYYQMKVRSDGSSVYVLFNNTGNKLLKGKWIKLTSGEYTTLGEKLFLPELFEVVEPESSAEIEEEAVHFLNVALKSELLTVYPFTIEDGLTEKNATRYNFEYGEQAIKPFFAAMEKYDADHGESTEEYATINRLLKDEKVVAYIADTSYMSIWIDNTTKMPIRIVDSFWITEKTGKKAKPINSITSTSITKFNSTQMVTTPTSTISYAEAVKIMKLK